MQDVALEFMTNRPMPCTCSEIDVDYNTVQRPTEAQLRWAYFHRSERVRETKDRIDRLMKFHSSDVDTNVGGDDGDISLLRSLLLERSPECDSAKLKAYLGIRQNRQGKWVRRHFSQSRFPKLASKQNYSKSDQLNWCESKHSVTSLRKHRKKKILVSKGRQAMLRVSARAYEERKNQLIPLPFTPATQSRNPDSTPIIHTNCAILPKRTTRKVIRNGYYIGPALASGEISNLALNGDYLGSFATSSWKTKARGRKDAITAESTALHCWRTCYGQALCFTYENEERICRFEQAYNAIVIATSANCEDDEESVSTRWLKAGGKRWTRDPNISPALSIDGRRYDDLQRTPTISLKQMNAPLHCNGHVNGENNVEIYDQAVTWLTHVSRPSSVTSKNNSISDGPRGHCIERKLTNIDATVQEIEKVPHQDLMRKLQAIAHASPASAKYQSMQSKIKCMEGDGIAIVGNTQEGEIRANLPNTGVCDCPISYQIETDRGNPKLTHIDTTPSACSPPFAGVENETIKLNHHFNDSCLKYHGVMNTIFHSAEAMKKRRDNHSQFPTKREIQGNVTVLEETESETNRVLAHSDFLRNGGGCVDSGFVGTGQTEVNHFCKNDELSTNQDYRSDVLFHSIRDSSDLNIATFVKGSLVTCMLDPSAIDLDSTESDAGIDEVQCASQGHSMPMSPSVITRRYQQALNAIVAQNWNQVSYLINASPWLLEMKDVRNDQNLVHSLSLFGGGQNVAEFVGSLEKIQPLPKQLLQSIIAYEPHVVHKLDIEGNLPLHMAAASGNIIMIRELGQRFSGAASVQNHSGLLPLHLAIMSCAFPPTHCQSVERIISLFPGAVFVKDNDGNTPLHVAAGTLRGNVGAHIIHQLVKGCHTLMLENSVFFERHSVREKITINADATTGNFPGDLQADPNFYIATNNEGETPLTRAIKSLAGRQVIEAFLETGGQLAALGTDSFSRNALHLALDKEFHDSAVVLSILKSTPITATIADGNGMLPIQLARMNSLQHEIILAIAVLDLPIDLGAKQAVIERYGFGASWWYLLCESDDMYVGAVTKILSLCSHPQKIALCLTEKGSGHGSKIAVTCATPLCKMELRRSLRVFGRFEVVGGEKKSHVFSRHVQRFDAIDYGTHEKPIQDGKKVDLVCYTDAKVYTRDAKHLHRCLLDTKLFEEMSYFTAAEIEANSPCGVAIQYCVAVNKSMMSLANVVAGMPNYHRYRSDSTILGRYFGKSRSIIRPIAQALTQMHAIDIIHGLVDSNHIGKFGGRWKILGLPGSIIRGENFAPCRLGLHSPPEAFVLAHSKRSRGFSHTSFAPSVKAEPSVDVWAFGKLMYEVLVGESLFMVFSDNDNFCASRCILTWNDENLKKVSNKLLDERIGSTGVDLISCCLCPKKSARTKSMSDILQHPFWRDENAFNLS
ncbi:hypothetical protein ACHAXR_007868 [Thalassiosira sp. AJA248-18]